MPFHPPVKSAAPTVTTIISRYRVVVTPVRPVASHDAPSQLFQALRLEVSKDLIFNGIADFKWIAADLAVFDVGVMVNREV